MQRISTATKKVDAYGSGKPGFTDGDPQAGEAPTELDSTFFGGVQEEILGPVEHVGRTPDADDLGQLTKASRDLHQLAEWRREAPDANDNVAGAFRPKTGTDEPLILVFDGTNTRKYSIDGLTWSSGGGLGPFTEIFDALWSASDGKFYLVGTATSVGVTSLDADFSGAATYALGGVAYNGVAHDESSGALVVVGAGGSLYTSTNGTGWVERDSNTANNLAAVATDGDGTWLAVADNGVITRATNLTSWSTVVTGTTADLRGVAYGAGVWVAVGDDEVRVSSNGGTAWVAATSLDDVSVFRQVRWNARHSVFMAVGDEASGHGVIAISRDGDVWHKVRPRNSARNYDVIETDDQTIVIGSNGGILSTARSFNVFA